MRVLLILISKSNMNTHTIKMGTESVNAFFVIMVKITLNLKEITTECYRGYTAYCIIALKRMK